MRKLTPFKFLMCSVTIAMYMYIHVHVSYCCCMLVGVVEGWRRWTVERGKAEEAILYSSRLAPGAGLRVTK